MSNNPQATQGSAKKGFAVALGVALPLATSLYTQSQERVEQARLEERQDQAAQQAVLDRDAERANALEERLRNIWSKEAFRTDPGLLCEALSREILGAREGTHALPALKTLAREFAIPLSGKATSATSGFANLVACRCDSEVASFREILLSKAPSPLQRKTTRLARESLATKLKEAQNRCEQSSEEAIQTASTPTPVPVEPVATDDAAAARKRYEQISDLKIRVYVQLPRESDESTQCLRTRLEGLGYKVPAFEVVTAARTPQNTQVRYVRSDEQSAAKVLVGDLALIQRECADTKGQFIETQLPSEPSDFSRLRINARPYHFELWVGSKRNTGEKQP